MKKIIAYVWIIALTLYAPIELTRCITIYELVLRQHPDILIGNFVLEIAVVCVGYIIAMGLVAWVFFKKDKYELQLVWID